jgi:hypothetical protein
MEEGAVTPQIGTREKEKRRIFGSAGFRPARRNGTNSPHRDGCNRRDDIPQRNH